MPSMTAPTPIGPAGSTTNASPPFSWNAVVGAAHYDLWVDGLVPVQAQIIRQQNVSTTVFTPTIALIKGTYRFWVRAVNGQGETGAWSDPLEFTAT